MIVSWQGMLAVPLVACFGTPCSSSILRRNFRSIPASFVRRRTCQPRRRATCILSNSPYVASPLNPHLKAATAASRGTVHLTNGTIDGSLSVAPVSAESQNSHKDRRVVFVRHGQSDFNLYNIFTGWCDVDINAAGEAECRKAGMLLASLGYEFDLAYTSVLKRGIKSLWMALDGCDQTYLPVHMSWKLNERHYGALQGLSKDESEERLGPIVREWRRSWKTKPPDMDETHPHWATISNDRRYRNISGIPRAESLEMCAVRTVDYWQKELSPAIQSGQRPIVMAHANSLRSLIKVLDEMEDDAIRKIKIPNGKPFVYRFDENMRPLGEPNEHGFRGEFLEEANVQQIYHRKMQTFFRHAPELNSPEGHVEKSQKPPEVRGDAEEGLAALQKKMGLGMEKDGVGGKRS